MKKWIFLIGIFLIGLVVGSQLTATMYWEQTTQDTFIDSVDKYNRWPDAKTMMVAYKDVKLSEQNIIEKEDRALIKFNVEIPENLHIYEARLVLSINTVVATEGTTPTLFVNQATSDWNLDVNWVTQPTYEMGTGNVITSPTSLRHDVTDTVQDWVNGEANYGFVLTCSKGSSFQIDSSNHEVAQYAPKLEINYELPTGEDKDVVIDSDVDTTESDTGTSTSDDFESKGEFTIPTWGWALIIFGGILIFIGIWRK